MKQTIRTFFALGLLVALALNPSWANPTDQPADEHTTDYILTSAYPNPFNASTTFKLTVKKNQQVTVAIYSALGQQVKSLYDGQMRANESKSFTFEAEGLPTGIYLYQVKGETFRIARQVSFIK